MSRDETRSVCVVLVDRANYGRLKPVMAAIAAHPRLRLQVLAAGTMVLERFDQPVKVVRADGFPIDGEVFLELEGSTPTTMAKSHCAPSCSFDRASKAVMPVFNAVSRSSETVAPKPATKLAISSRIGLMPLA